MPFRFLARSIVGWVLALALSACTNLWQAGWQTAQQALPQKITAQSITLDPQLRYLKVAINEHEVLMVEAYRSDSDSVWVSSDLAILKTRNGYLTDLEGFRINWQEVRGLNLVTAAQLAKPTAYTRVRNEMPGYRYQIRESVLVSPLERAPEEIQLIPPRNANLRWFSEEVRTQMGERAPNYRYPGFFAIDISQHPYQVVFGQQCLGRGYCIRWQVIEPSESLGRAQP
jgi:hypothetical protein